MTIRVAINGFGRIGRLLARAGLDNPNIEFVAVNDLTDTKTLATLFKYDTAHRTFQGTVNSTDSHLEINGKQIQVFSEKDPANLPWKDLNVDIVAECTGFFTKDGAASKHLEAGAKKVIVSAPCKCEGKTCPVEITKTIVKGVNEQTYDPAQHNIISNASCTTNCAAPVMKVLNDNFKVVKGYITTIHGYTSTQKLVDGPDKDLRRARAAAQNIIPTTTGAAVAVTEVIPELLGKLDAIAMRVPVITGSISDFNIEVEKDVTVEEINKTFKSVAENELKGIVQYNEDPIVSTDIITNPHSAIFDAPFTKVLGGRFIKCLAWYDNEWGFSCRMVDMLQYIGEKL